MPLPSTPPSLRILQVCSAETFGGGERHVSDLSAWLAGRGYEVHLAVRHGSPLLVSLASSKIHWHILPLRGAADIISIGRLARIISQHQIDVLHAHVARDYPMCGAAAKLAEVDLYLTRHHFNPLSGGSVYAWAINRVRSWIAVSESVAEGLKRSFPSQADRIRVIPNWIDLRTFDNTERESARARLGARRGLVAAVIGQITPLKRQDLFIRAGAILLTEHPQTDLELMIIGGTESKDQRYREGLQSLADDLGISDRVRFIGHRDDLRSLYPGFDVVVAPSVNEGFSLVLIEAMAARRAVIASNSGGMAEIVSDGITGRLVAPDADRPLAGAMIELLEDADLRFRFGNAAAQSVRDRYDREKVLPLIEALYNRGK